MRSSSRKIWPAGVAVTILTGFAGASRPAFAEEFTFEVVKSFDLPDSSLRSALALGSDGAFYGTTAPVSPSNRGTIFRIDGAGDVTRLHSFSGDGGTYAPLVLGSDGALYGTAGGGSFGWGMVFKVDGAGEFTPLHSFTEPGLSHYSALVLGSDGALYGRTYGGSSGASTVFRIDSAGSFTTVHSFSGADGVYPSSLVVGSDGALYGTTGGLASDIGGASDGTIFRIDNAGTFTTLHRFSGTDGSAPYPVPLTLGSDGALYGFTQAGGSRGRGTIYRIDSAGSFTTLHSFGEGAYPAPAAAAPLVLGSDGALYGTAYGYGSDTLFRIDGSGNFTVIGYGDFGGTDLVGGTGLVLGSDGAFYGITRGGNVFRIDSMGTYTNPSSSDETVGAIGFGPLVLGRDGALYGTSSRGGTAGLGAFVRVDPETYTILFSFPGVDGGDGPRAALVAGSDGALYGTTELGGPFDMGTVFRIDGAGAFTSLHSFSGSDGAYPSAALIRGSDGALYGTTSGAPTNWTQWARSAIPTIFKIDRAGTFTSLHSSGDSFDTPDTLIPGSGGSVYWSTIRAVYKIDGAGTFTVLHSFGPGLDDCDYMGAQYGFGGTNLVMGSDGALYGIHSEGFPLSYIGCDNYPTSTFFRIDSAGTFTSLSEFSGTYGRSALIMGSDGAFYGTASDTIFRIDSAGSLTTVHQEAYFSSSRFVVGTDGALYGTTPTASAGAVFRLDNAGNFTTLHSFTYADGYNPPALSVLNLGRDGALYGTTLYGGPSGAGTVFRIDNAGAFTPLHSFEYTDGASPSAPPTLGGDCALYGTAAGGGPAYGGVVYRLYEPGHLCQRIDFDPLPDRVVGDLPFTVTATASSGLPVSFSASGRCTLSGNQVLLKKGVGMCRVSAHQTGDSRFEPAAEVTQEFRVGPRGG